VSPSSKPSKGALSGLLAAIREFLGQLLVEKQHRFADGTAIFDRAEAQNVYTDLPADVLG
jgi:hypothetical protein